MATQYLTLVEAAKECPRPVHSSAIWRWARKGIKANTGRIIRLRTIQQGRTLLTTREWLHEFFTRQTNENNRGFAIEDADDLSCELSATDRAAAADAQLEAAGL